MASIQDIHALEQRIYVVKDDYILEACLAVDQHVGGQHGGMAVLKADSREAIKEGETTELYPMKDLMRIGKEYNVKCGCFARSARQLYWMEIGTRKVMCGEGKLKG